MRELQHQLWICNNNSSMITTAAPTLDTKSMISRGQILLNSNVRRNQVETLEHFATNYNALQHIPDTKSLSCAFETQRLTATAHCNKLQHTATHCNTLQHTATHRNTLCIRDTAFNCNSILQLTATYCNALQHTAPHSAFETQLQNCNTSLQHTVTHCSALQHIHCSTLWHNATPCNTLRHKYQAPRRLAALSRILLQTATHCNTLQHAAIHCNTLQHTHRATRRQAAYSRHCSKLQQHTATHCNTHTHTQKNTHTHTRLLVFRLLIQKGFPEEQMQIDH